MSVQNSHTSDPCFKTGVDTPEKPCAEPEFVFVEQNVIDPDSCFRDKLTKPLAETHVSAQTSNDLAFAFEEVCQPSVTSEAEQLDSHAEKVTQSSGGGSRPSTPLSSSNRPSLQTPNRINMPTILTTQLGDIELHSPSSQIVGTPFATNTTRFEYPFPDVDSGSSSNPTSPPISSHISPITSTISQPPIPSGSSFPLISTSPPTHPGPLPPNAFPTHGGSPPSFTFIHPKLKTVIPPIPPSLIKKRPKWTLGLLGRRRSSQGSHSSAGDATDVSIDSVLGAQSPPLPIPKEDPHEAK